MVDEKDAELDEKKRKDKEATANRTSLVCYNIVEKYTWDRINWEHFSRVLYLCFLDIFLIFPQELALSQQKIENDRLKEQLKKEMNERVSVSCPMLTKLCQVTNVVYLLSHDVMLGCRKAYYKRLQTWKKKRKWAGSLRHRMNR